MLTIPNLPTQDNYVAALTLGPAPSARMIKYVVANKAAFMRVWPQSKSGTIPAQTDELLVTPETNIITDAMGVQFRSALPGVAAQVVAQLLEPGDPTFGGGTPFSSTISSSGGISPGVSAVQIQKNGGLIGTEPALDFIDGHGWVWVMADDPANTRVTVAVRPILAGQITATGVINSGTGFTVTHTGVGNYRIDWAAGVGLGTPVVLATPIGNVSYVEITALSSNSVSIQFVNNGGAAADCAFNFLITDSS